MKEKFDYIVVGAGAAGSVVAARLSEDPGTSVLVLEAGPSDASIYVRMPGAQAYPLMDRKRTWLFDTGPEPSLEGRMIAHLRGRMLGGSSSLNGMVYVRGNPRDFDGWAQSGLPDWSYAHCLPYFKKLESYDRGANEYRGASGPVSISTMQADLPIFQAFLAAGQQAGQVLNPDYNGFRQEGIHVHQANIDHGVRASAGRAYLRPAVAAGRVELRLNALVTKLRFHGKTAIGVDYRCAGVDHSVAAEREVILCGGAYNSPHLLMLSGIGAAAHLREQGITPVADVPGVGRSLQDHPCVGVKYRSRIGGVSPGYNMSLLDKAWTGAKWLLARTGLGASNLWETGSFFKSHPDVDYANIQHEFVPLLGEYGQGEMVVQEGFYYSTCLMRPRSRGFLELRSADPTALPRIVHNYLEHPEDQKALIAAVKFTDEIIQQPAWNEIRGAPVTPALREMSDAEVLTWLRANTSTQYHPCATCRMGTDETSVVDAEGRVHDVQNLRVIDASVIPSITSGNLQSPTLMVAERLVDRMRGRSLAAQPVPYADRINRHQVNRSQVNEP
jgi:choline dehydrogenase